MFSRAISRVKWLRGEKTNVSKNISVLVLRVMVGRRRRRRRRSRFTADQTGQQALDLGFEPLLGLLTGCLLS
jgi:hypothetical protein